MATGFFLATLEPNDTRNIRFERVGGTTGAVPADQSKLLADIEKALTLLRALCKDIKSPAYDFYFLRLLELSKLGLVGPTADPGMGSKALEELKFDVVLNEGARVKNSYMLDLGKKALIYAIIPASVGVAIFLLCDQTRFFFRREIGTEIRDFSLIWAGSMVGTWLSFATRKTHMEFEDLVIVEEDQIGPGLRLIYVGVISLVFGLLALLRIAVLKIGPVSTDSFGSNALLALALGISLGIAEKTLPSQLLKSTNIFGNSTRT